MPDMPEVPEGRCMVCRAAWEPCRQCKGKVLKAKQEATMRRKGTVVVHLPRGPRLKWGLNLDKPRDNDDA